MCLTRVRQVLTIVGLVLIVNASTGSGGMPSTASSAPGLTFSRATDDESVYANSPSQYDRMTLPIPGLEVVYVEHNAVLEIPLREIRSVSVSKERIPQTRQEREEIIREELGKSPRKPPRADAPPEAYYYLATFLLNRAGANKLAEFSKRNTNGLLVLSLTSHRFAVATFPQPLTGERFAVDLYEKDRDKIEMVFAPVQTKLRWQ